MISEAVERGEPHPPGLNSPGQSSLRWWVVACVGACVLAVVWALYVASSYTAEEQRKIAAVSTVWGMHACVLVIGMGFAALTRTLVRMAGQRHCMASLGLVLLGYAACGLAPKTNRIFFDEHIYMQIGQTLSHTGRAEMADYGMAEYGEVTIHAPWENKQPNGHPYLLSWAFSVFGVSEDVAHQTVRVGVGLSAGLLYLALVFAPWSLPRWTPLAASLGLIATPLTLWWGHTVAVEPMAMMTTVLAVFAVCVHLRLRTGPNRSRMIGSASLWAATLAFAGYFRPESLLVYPVTAAMLLASDLRAVRQRVTWETAALSIALLIPNLMHLWSVRTEDWGATDGRRFNLEFLAENLRSNAGYFVRGEFFPIAGTILAVLGSGWLLRYRFRASMPLVLWFSMSWGIFVLFYAGGYHYGASSRYAVVSIAPVAVFMGVGASVLFRALRAWPAAAAGMGLAIAMNWISSSHFVPTVGREANQARAEVAFVRETAAQLPTGALVISNDPCVWNLQHKNAGQIHALEGALRTDMKELVRQYPGGLYLHWDYWANCDEEFAALSRQLILDTQAEMVFRVDAENYQYALFRVDTPHALQVFGGNAEPILTPFDVDTVAEEVAAGVAGQADPTAVEGVVP